MNSLSRAPRILLRALLLLGLALHSFAYAATKKPPLKPVNINVANSAELQQVPGIGPATAEKILQMRKSYGAFKSVDDLQAIRGIGKKRLDKMRKYLVAGTGATPPRTAPPGKRPSKSAATPAAKTTQPAAPEEPNNF